MVRVSVVIVAVGLALSPAAHATGSLELDTPVVDDAGGLVPAFRCRAETPPLAWRAAPAGTRSFVVIIDDDGAADREVVHFVAYNLPSTTQALSVLPPGAMLGYNAHGERAFAPLCPTDALHVYRLRVYALDVMLPAFADPTRERLLTAMSGHVLATGEVVATTLPSNLSAHAATAK